ncbi:MAG: acyl carrier protein [Clostridiales bacterium]|jgi:acyl carrier protein|nr:acyl carrier protein [Clostridiales bacterium]
MFDKVAQLLNQSREIPLDKITPTSTFADLGLDSLDVVDLLMLFEDEFKVSIELNDNIKTVGDLANLIQSLKK